MSKPREFASLIKNKFGSADNITTLSKQDSNVTEDNHSPSVIPEDFERSHHGSATLTHSTKYTSDDECLSVSSGSGPNGLISSPKNQPFQSGPIMSLDTFVQELQESREMQQRLQDSIEGLKSQMQQDYTLFTQALQEERYRYERLEEQLNDLIELHQNEIENLKQGISDMEEKVQYQSEERLRDMHEMLENCQTRISRIEHQQQHQQLVNIEGLENSNARALILKLINVVLAVLQVILVLVSTTANLITPFLKTRLRILTTSLLIAVLVMVIKQWSEFVDIGRYFLGKHKHLHPHVK